MTRLERRYRLLLRLLPGWYRAEREEEMVATLLADRDDEFDLEYGWPGWREAWAVAVRVRQRPDAPARTLLIGDALRLVALAGLLAEASLTAGLLIVVLAGPDTGAHPYPAWLPVHLAGSLSIIAAYGLLLTARAPRPITVDYARFAHDSGPLALTAAQVAALAGASAVLAPIAVRALRRTPPAPVPA